MFDMGWMELLIIGVVALIVVGPKDLPMMFKTVGNFVGKAKRMAREFQTTMNAAASETGLNETADILKTIDKTRNPKAFFENAKEGLIKAENDENQKTEIVKPSTTNDTTNTGTTKSD